MSRTRSVMRGFCSLAAVAMLTAGGGSILDARPIRQAQQTPRYHPIVWENEVSGKNFPLFAIIDADASAREALAAAPGLRSVFETKRAALAAATTSCGPVASCHVAALSWSDDDIARVSEALIAVTRSGVLTSVIERMRATGLFVRDSHLDDETFLVRSWERAARGLNNVLVVYGRGGQPRYPAIDAVSHDAESADYGRIVHTAIGLMDEKADDWGVFYEPTLAFALRLLDINWRDESARHEPMHLGENAAAYRRIPTITRSDYPYTVALVPGSGLSDEMERQNHALSSMGRLIVELAARRYHDKRVPLIIVSGGYVHPKHTRFAEAVEMKRSLMRDFDVPEDAILIDPHARHTTTNIRNAARLIFRYGIPAGRPALITTQQYHLDSIAAVTFADRCDRELGYQPFELKRRLSRFELEWLPRVEALHADPLDPLDP